MGIQYSPINVELLLDIDHLEQTVVIIMRKGLSKNVRSVIGRWDLFDYDDTSFHQLANTSGKWEFTWGP